MTTAATAKTTLLPDFVQGELPLAARPISAQRALEAYRRRVTDVTASDAGSTTSGNSSSDDKGIDEETTTTKRIKFDPKHGTSIPELINTYTNLDHLKTLEEGGCLFSFRCCRKLKAYEVEMVDAIINLSAFDNEVTENHVPHFQAKYYKEAAAEGEEDKDKAAEDEQEQEETPPEESPDALEEEQPQPQEETGQHFPYTILLARSSYLLFDIDLSTLLSPKGLSILSSAEYHKACEPSGTKVWTDVDNMQPNTFRITKPIVPKVFGITVQCRVSALTDGPLLRRLGRHVGTRVDGGFLLERTKRSYNPKKEDATKKTKSVLLYTDLGSGAILVTHLTVVLQKSLPATMERLINYLPNRFQSWGLGETCETAFKTRKYLAKAVPANKKEGEENSLQDKFASCNVSSEDDEDDDEFLDAQASFDT